MNKTKIVFGIGIVLTALALLTAPAIADNIIRLEPSDITSGVEEEVTDVWVYLNATDAVAGFQFHLQYEDDVVDIVNVTSAETGTNPAWLMWEKGWKVYSEDGHHYLFVSGSMLMSTVTGDNIELAKISLKGLNPGGKPLEFCGNYYTTDGTAIIDLPGDPLPLTRINGTFTCTAPPETFDKTLVTGWNLISLPLTATDMTVSNVMASLTYDELYRYNATTNSYAALASGDIMANGVGYFINMTAEDTWTYSGTAYMSMNEGYLDGLNMIGWLNCTKDISATGLDDTAKTYYISRWDATTQEYETYNPVAPGDFNDFTQMVRGEGYFVSMKTGGTLSESC